MAAPKNFVFYSNWRDYLEKLSSKDDQHQLMKLIIDYGVTGEYDAIGVDPMILNTFESIIKPSIDRSQRNYANSQNYGKEFGRPKTVNDELIIELFKNGHKAESIAKELGISVASVYHSEGWKHRKEK